MKDSIQTEGTACAKAIIKKGNTGRYQIMQSLVSHGNNFRFYTQFIVQLNYERF
jgi:hypothetical protein